MDALPVELVEGLFRGRFSWGTPWVSTQEWPVAALVCKQWHSIIGRLSLQTQRRTLYASTVANILRHTSLPIDAAVGELCRMSSGLTTDALTIVLVTCDRDGAFDLVMEGVRASRGPDLWSRLHGNKPHPHCALGGKHGRNDVPCTVLHVAARANALNILGRLFGETLPVCIAESADAAIIEDNVAFVRRIFDRDDMRAAFLTPGRITWFWQLAAYRGATKVLEWLHACERRGPPGHDTGANSGAMVGDEPLAKRRCTISPAQQAVWVRARNQAQIVEWAVSNNQTPVVRFCRRRGICSATPQLLSQAVANGSPEMCRLLVACRDPLDATFLAKASECIDARFINEPASLRHADTIEWLLQQDWYNAPLTLGPIMAHIAWGEERRRPRTRGSARAVAAVIKRWPHTSFIWPRTADLRALAFDLWSECAERGDHKGAYMLNHAMTRVANRSFAPAGRPMPSLLDHLLARLTETHARLTASQQALASPMEQQQQQHRDWVRWIAELVRHPCTECVSCGSDGCMPHSIPRSRLHNTGVQDRQLLESKHVLTG